MPKRRCSHALLRPGDGGPQPGKPRPAGVWPTASGVDVVTRPKERFDRQRDLDPERLVFIDEAWVDKHGAAPCPLPSWG